MLRASTTSSSLRSSSSCVAAQWVSTPASTTASTNRSHAPLSLAGAQIISASALPLGALTHRVSAASLSNSSTATISPTAYQPTPREQLSPHTLTSSARTVPLPPLTSQPVVLTGGKAAILPNNLPSVAANEARLAALREQNDALRTDLSPGTTYSKLAEQGRQVLAWDALLAFIAALDPPPPLDESIGILSTVQQRLKLFLVGALPAATAPDPTLVAHALAAAEQRIAPPENLYRAFYNLPCWQKYIWGGYRNDSSIKNTALAVACQRIETRVYPYSNRGRYGDKQKAAFNLIAQLIFVKALTSTLHPHQQNHSNPPATGYRR